MATVSCVNVEGPDTHHQHEPHDTLHAENPSNGLIDEYNIMPSSTGPTNCCREIRTVQLRWHCVGALASVIPRRF